MVNDNQAPLLLTSPPHPPPPPPKKKNTQTNKLGLEEKDNSPSLCSWKRGQFIAFVND